MEVLHHVSFVRRICEWVRKYSFQASKEIIGVERSGVETVRCAVQVERKDCIENLPDVPVIIVGEEVVDAV